MSEIEEPAESELDTATKLLQSMGFLEFDIKENPEAVIAGIRWKCSIRTAWGRSKNWGCNPKEAVLRVLASNPRPPRS